MEQQNVSLSFCSQNVQKALKTYNELPEQAHVALMIYDLKGREVKTLVNRVEAPGYKGVVWDGANSVGQPVSSGVYLYRIRAEGASGRFEEVMKMVLLR